MKFSNSNPLASAIVILKKAFFKWSKGLIDIAKRNINKLPSYI